MKTNASSGLGTARLYSTKSIPLALLLVCILAHGLLIPWLGFYWDDWPTVWFLNRWGPTIFNAAYGIDRPALGWLFTGTSTLIGQSALAWQIFAVLTRWIACLSLWAMLRAVWPARKIETAWVAFLFVIYPGFMQQPVALTYSADWIAITLFFLSFWLMLKAIRLSIITNADHRLKTRAWPFVLIVVSWVMAAYVMFADEYYFGLEMLRPIFLWLILNEVTPRKPEVPDRSRHFWRVMLWWLPYLVIMLLFLYWRLVVFVSPRGEVEIFDQLASQPLAAILSLAANVLKDLYQSGIAAWVQTFFIHDIVPAFNSPRLQAAYISLIILAAGLLIYYFNKVQLATLKLDTSTSSASKPYEQKTWAMQATIIGIFALLVGGLPFWVTNLPIELYFPWDRFNLAMMFGACLALAGIIVFLARTPQQKAVIFGVLGALAIGFHLYNANLFRRDWNLQRDFFWQLTWRVPGLVPGTLLLAHELPFRYFSDNSLTAPLNLIYAPQEHSLQLPYMLYSIKSRLGLGLTALKKGLPIEQQYRMASFSGSTSDMIVLHYDPPRCLKIMDPGIDLLLPRKPGSLDEAIPLSNLDLIEVNATDPALLPDEFFGAEPAHNWCYYFQKADLARQRENWGEIVRLGDAALSLPVSFTRENSSELIPFIQGYARVGQWDKAVQLTNQAYEVEPKTANMLCPIWYDLQSDNLPESQRAFRQVSEALSCEF